MTIRTPAQLKAQFMGTDPADQNSDLVDTMFPQGGNWFFVDAVSGSDTTGTGSITAPYATVSKAYDQTVSLHNDVVAVIARGTSVTEAAALTWSNSYTHLIGLCSPIPDEQRSRIKCAAGLVTTPFVTWSGSGCIVKNISFWHETSSALGLVNVLVSGGRNYFEHCQFAGAIGTNNATGARSLIVGGANASGNTFRECTIGNDTVQIVDGVYGLEFVTGAMHTNFIDCTFNHAAGATTNSHVSIAAAAGVGRRNIFKRCLFLNETAVAQAEVFTVGAALARANYVLMLDCWTYGVAKWDANNYGIVTNVTIAANHTGVNTGNIMKITSG